MWPQYWDLQGPRGLEQRDLRNLNLEDLKKGPNGSVSPTPQKKAELLLALFFDLTRWRRHVPPKRRWTINGLYDVISQKTELFKSKLIFI
jgi:hypothetical protein